MSFNSQTMPRTDPTTARTREYGWSQVAASTVYECFREIAANSEPTFVLLKDKLLARQSSEDIAQMIAFSSSRGGMYAFRWGVSLGFVPHEWNPRPKYHRTLKSSRFDLWENPADFLVTDPYSGEDWDYLVDAMHGELCMRRDIQAVWSKLQPVINAFFSSVGTLDGVLQKASQHAAKTWTSFRHHPDPKVVQAFTLARLGRLPEAERLLGEFLTGDKSFEAPQELLATLRKIPS